MCGISFLAIVDFQTLLMDGPEEDSYKYCNPKIMGYMNCMSCIAKLVDYVSYRFYADMILLSDPTQLFTASNGR